MLYIKDIFVGDISLTSWTCSKSKPDMTVRLSDGRTELVQDCPANVAGFADNGDNYVVVVYSPKCLKFLDYVLSVETVGYADVPKDCDAVIFDGHVWNNSFCGSDSIAVTVEKGITRIMGVVGCVARIYENGQWDELTLYDFLCSVMLYAKVGLFRYETIYIHGSLGINAYKLRLRHDADANRFFAKMSWDVMR